MSNSYFQFKQFKIEQGQCAMKVSTDACIQGAWTPVDVNAQQVLDIGCGTGLLSLMLAQRFPEIKIDALELDEHATVQAKENVEASPWKGRIEVFQGDVREYPFAEHSYDHVICNPPFFQNSLLGPDALRNQARHTHSLSFQELFAVIEKVLMPEGEASVLLPAKEHEVWETLLTAHGWQLHKKLLIVPRAGGQSNRVVSICGRQSIELPEVQTLDIRQQDGQYTETFTQLLQPFYLHL